MSSLPDQYALKCDVLRFEDFDDVVGQAQAWIKENLNKPRKMH